MHYHIAKNPDYHGASLPNWYTDKCFAVLPEVTSEELARSTIPCTIRDGLIVVKPVGERTLEVLVNNNGRRREFTPRQVVDFLITCQKKRDSVSIDDNLASTYMGKVIEREAGRIFGEDGYVLASARRPGSKYLASQLPTQRAPATQQPHLR